MYKRKDKRNYINYITMNIVLVDLVFYQTHK